MSAAQAQAVYDCARRQNLLVVEAFWTKFLPIYREVERRVASGVIGDIRLVTAQYGYTTAREAVSYTHLLRRRPAPASLPLAAKRGRPISGPAFF